MNYLENRLYPYKTFEKYFSDITNAFIRFYGEENSNYILEKFNNMIFICTRTPDGLKRLLNEIKITYSNMLIKKFIDRFNIEYKSNNIKNIFGASKTPFENASIIPVAQYIKFKKSAELCNNIEKQLSDLFCIYNLNDIETYLEDIIQEYKTYIKQFKSLENYIEYCNNIKEELQKKYMDELVHNFKNKFDSKEYETYLKSKKVIGKMKIYLGSRIEISPLISAFSKESNRILNDPNSKRWKKDSIKKNRISFFKKMGINLGDNYKTYMNDQRCVSLIPPIDLVEDIIDTKEELEIKMYNEYFMSLPEYISNRNMIDEEGLFSKNDGYNLGTLLYSDTYVTPNVKIDSNSIILYPLVNINFDYPNEFLDKYIIHELNHVYELNLACAEDEVKYSCGWDLICEISTEKRKYENFNEIINDIIADEITTLLHNDGIYMFYDKFDAKVKGGTCYENLRFLVQRFYDEFKEDILISRRYDINYIFEACGKENFEELNDLVNLFRDKWNSFGIIQLLSDIRKGHVNKNTKEYYKILKKRDLIINNMIQYRKGMKNKELVLCQKASMQ